MKSPMFFSECEMVNGDFESESAVSLEKHGENTFSGLVFSDGVRGGHSFIGLRDAGGFWTRDGRRISCYGYNISGGLCIIEDPT